MLFDYVMGGIVSLGILVYRLRDEAVRATNTGYMKLSGNLPRIYTVI